MQKIRKQAEAEVVPSASLVKVMVEVEVKVEVGVGWSSSSRDEFTIFLGVGGWLGGVEEWRIKLTSVKVEVEVEVEAELDNKNLIKRFYEYRNMFQGEEI